MGCPVRMVTGIVFLITGTKYLTRTSAREEGFALVTEGGRTQPSATEDNLAQARATWKEEVSTEA